MAQRWADAASLAAANAVNALSQAVVLVVLARYVTQRVVGDFALATGITGPVFLFFNCQLRDYRAADQRAVSSPEPFVGMRVLGSFAAAGLSSVLLVAGPFAEARWILAVVVARAIDSLTDLGYGELIRNNRCHRVSVAVTTGGVTTAITIAALAVLHQPTAAIMCGLIVGPIAALAIVVQGLGREFKAAYRPDLMFTAETARLVSAVLPLGFASGLTSLAANLPRFLLAAFLGPVAVAHFAAASSFYTAGAMLIGAAAQSSAGVIGVAVASKGPAEGVRLAVKLSLLTAVVAGAVALILALVAAPLLVALYGAPYRAASNVLVLVLVSTIAAYPAFFLNLAALATSRSHAQTIAVIGGMCVNSIASSVLIPRVGMEGAGWGVLLASMTQTLMMAVFLKVGRRETPRGANCIRRS